MNRKLIIDGNAVYEIDESCMLKNKTNKMDIGETQEKQSQKAQEQQNKDKNKRRE